MIMKSDLLRKRKEKEKKRERNWFCSLKELVSVALGFRFRTAINVAN
jgi:hypothetical protein